MSNTPMPWELGQTEHLNGIRQMKVCHYQVRLRNVTLQLNIQIYMGRDFAQS